MMGSKHKTTWGEKMFELVPSQLMRDFYNEKGFVFSDFQKATLIWNAPRNRQEIVDDIVNIG